MSGSSGSLDIISPLDGSTISQVFLSNADDLDKAVIAARESLPSWAGMPIKERVQIFFKYKQLLEKNMEELTNLVVEECGKTYGEAKAEVLKSAELTEFACSMPQLLSAEFMEVSNGVECKEERYPVGVVASISPFNFPNMVPNWTLPNALVLGNTMILKPSELVPLSANRIAELLTEAGLPKGVFNVVHGARETVEAICDNPGIDAISFVGSTKVAKIVYKRGTSNLKRVLALGGAKNHLIVLPDAHVKMTGSNVAGSMSGCAGQRCMAAASMLAVGDVEHIIDEVCNEARKIIPGENLGAIISAEGKTRIENYITEAENDGAKILVDGRNAIVKGKENGFYVGPTVIDFVTPDMRIANEEVFGPVLSILRVENIDKAIEIENSSKYGNAAAVFTQSGGAATFVAKNVSAGMIGVNIGVPVPREPFAFGGWNESKFGVGDITGRSSIEFWTKTKKITTKWNPESQVNWMS
ncbi:MAG: CoA-acylating methylmalonate-semialdehyde dehydrogenase [Melioribacteraceae bacterium]|nr:CoA-acylating methylmalonate-semialdehyde dehydrogenase [Melioribacteraceae bacterium]